MVAVTRAFGTNALPMAPRDRYLPNNQPGPIELTTWDSIIQRLQTLFSLCVASHEQPGWIDVGRNLTALIVPNDSGFRRRWLDLSPAFGILGQIPLHSSSTA